MGNHRAIAKDRLAGGVLLGAVVSGALAAAALGSAGTATAATNTPRAPARTPSTPSTRSSGLHTGNGVESQRLCDAKNATGPGANVSSMSDNEAWPWTVWQWVVLVVLVLLAAAVVAVDTHILFRGGWPLWPL